MMAYRLFSAGVWLARWLPARILYGLARAAGLGLSRLPLPAGVRLRRNLSHVLKVPPGSPKLEPYVRRSFQTQAQNYVDLCRAEVIAAGKLPEFVAVGDGWEPLLRRVRERQPAVVVTGHFGRIELLSHFLASLNIVLTLTVERLSPPQLFDLICRLRLKPTYTLVPHDAALRPCLRALARGEVTVFFADWDPSGHAVPVQLFGAPARLPAGPAMVARRANAPIFVGYQPAGDRPGVFPVAMEPALDIEWSDDAEADLRRATQQVANVYERFIRRSPGQWVMYHDIWPPDSALGAGMVECGASDTLDVAVRR